MQWHNIPAELRQLPQWICAGPDKMPLNPRTGQAASVVDPKTWGTYEEATRSGYRYIGFVLAEWDPYTIIDLDNKEDRPCTQEQWARHQKILEAFNSYTERSASGRGYHIIIKGKLPVGGVHRDNVEAYSHGRYMVCTGDVVRDVPITDFQGLLEQMYEEMKPAPQVELDECEELMSDAEVVDMAMNAVNGHKFNDLCNGHWAKMGYPSQSEADFALLAMFAYYSKSNEQVRRLFRYSKLGERDKAMRDNKYLNRALSKIRAHEPPPVDISALASCKVGVPREVQAPPEDNDTGETSTLQGTELPPGLVGEMAYYFWQTAVRPVPDVALAAALALMGGVAGRAYNISGTGLNQYLILLAKTGVGKEGAVTGIDNLVASVRPQVPMVDQFIGPSAFASGQAVIKVLDERPCFVSVLGEFGLTLQQLSDPNATASQIVMRKVLLDLYGKSGFTKVLRSSVYSDVEKNTKIVQAPCVTLLGESTPEAFYSGLDSDMIAEGLVPRFSVIDYKGDRPPRNRNANMPPPPGLSQRFADLVAIALTMGNNNTCMNVQLSTGAQVFLDEFDAECDAAINGAGGEVEAQLWNRAHLKALKLSALLAVGVNPHQPIVDRPIAEWSVTLVRRDIDAIGGTFKRGEVGRGDIALEAHVRRVVKQLRDMKLSTAVNYGVTKEMLDAGAVPWSYLAKRTGNIGAFKRDKRGSNAALKSAVQGLVDSGELAELPLGEVFARFSFRGRLFASVSPKQKQAPTKRC